MPPIAYWFSGAALAAFVVFVGAGYGWYRAALSEMQAAEAKTQKSDKERSDQDARARSTKLQNDLSGFIARGDKLLGRLMIATDATSEADAAVWNKEVMRYVEENLGAAYSVRLNSGTGITGFVQQAPEGPRRELHISTYIRLIRLQEFIKEISR